MKNKVLNMMVDHAWYHGLRCFKTKGMAVLETRDSDAPALSFMPTLSEYERFKKAVSLYKVED